MIESGLQASFVVVRADGEIIGHSALLLEDAGDVIVEGGRAMVDPRYRGHHLMGTLHDCRDAWMDEHGILALEGAAVTAHTRSQTDHPVMSVQLGFLPAISFRGIEGTEVAHREAVVGGMFAVAPVPPQAVHLPARDAAMLQEIYRLTELERSPAEGANEPAPGTVSQLRLDVRADLGHAVVTVGVIGADLAAEVRGRVATVVRGGVEVVYADIPLDRPEASWAADVLAAEGFVFSGVLPLAHRGVDSVRYQWLGDIVVDPDEIHLKHPFSRELLDYVLAQRAALPDPA
jgi:serine/threonine-protein kinase RsbW